MRRPVGIQGPYRRLQPVALPDRAESRRARAGGSSTSTTTATSCACGSRTGRSCSWSSGYPARCGSGPNRSPPLRVPKLFDLRADPYERADITSNTYYDWLISQSYLLFVAQAATVQVPGHVQGLSPAPAGSELQHRPGRAADEAEPRRSLTVTEPGSGFGVSQPGFVVASSSSNRRDRAADFVQKRTGAVLLAPAMNVGPVDLVALYGDYILDILPILGPIRQQRPV